MARIDGVALLVIGWIAASSVLAQDNPLPQDAARPTAESAGSIVLAGKRLEIDLAVDRDVEAVELRLDSFRNRPVVDHATRSPLAPEAWSLRAPAPAERRMWYPVVDVAIDARTDAVAIFNSAPDGCRVYVNEIFHPESRPLEREVVVPAEQLEAWENLVFVDGSPAVELERFYVRVRLPAREGRVRESIELLSSVWHGNMSWRNASAPPAAPDLGTIEIAPRAASRRAAAGRSRYELFDLAPVSADPVSREELIAALRASVEFVLDARNTHAQSATRDGFYLLYDVDAATYRTSHWMWSWGVIIRMLLEADRLAEVAGAFDEDLALVAERAGRRSLDFQKLAPGHTTDGLVTARWNPGPQYDGGSQEFVATADALFLAGWAWGPLYEATSDKAFLQATQRLCAGVDRLAHEYGVVPQDWLPGDDEWTTRILNEVGFGAEGFAELYRLDGLESTRAGGKRFIDPVIERLERDDGLWERSWSATREPPPFGIEHTRGQAWAMEGLLAAHRMDPGGGYLARAERLAEHLLKHQHPSGCWAFEFNADIGSSGVADKGTAVWCLLMYRLHAANGDARALASARKALAFCIRHLDRSDDPHAVGSLVGSNPNSGIVYRHWYAIACTYTSGFLGLAIIEELKTRGEPK